MALVAQLSVQLGKCLFKINAWCPTLSKPDRAVTRAPTVSKILGRRIEGMSNPGGDRPDIAAPATTGGAQRSSTVRQMSSQRMTFCRPQHQSARRKPSTQGYLGNSRSPNQCCRAQEASDFMLMMLMRTQHRFWRAISLRRDSRRSHELAGKICPLRLCA
jgi:hypothetical protein